MVSGRIAFPLVIEEASFLYLRNNADTDKKITEMLAYLTLTRISAKCLFEHFENDRLGHILADHLVQTLAVETATKIQIVFSRRAPREANFGDVRPRATIGTTAHADGDRFITQTMSRHDLLNLGEKVWHVAFALCHCQATGG